MTTLMVWNYQVDHNTEGYSWVKVPTEYKVGTRAEFLFWRVMDAAHSSTEKDFFYSHREYEAFSGNPVDKEQADAWDEQHKSALKEFQITDTKRNATIVSNGCSYASFFPTEVEQQTVSTVS
uniref:Uncharacterized protein n=1 Tax=viral metagenome TaxID=1070528 RepID=A0A6C0IXY8_9ZZZZ